MTIEVTTVVAEPPPVDPPAVELVELELIKDEVNTAHCTLSECDPLCKDSYVSNFKVRVIKICSDRNNVSTLCGHRRASGEVIHRKVATHVNVLSQNMRIVSKYAKVKKNYRLNEDHRLWTKEFVHVTSRVGIEGSRCAPTGGIRIGS